MNAAIELEIELNDISPAPRVTLADVQNAIISEHYFTAEHGVIGSNPDVYVDLLPKPLRLMTFCVLVLWNGFTVTGQAAWVNAANFNSRIGEKIARDDAVKQIWPLMGYDLASRQIRDLDKIAPESDANDAGEAIVAAAQPLDGVAKNAAVVANIHIDRVKEEYKELMIKLNKLESFFTNHIFFALSKKEQSDLNEQASFMRGYGAILERRLAR